MVKSTLSYATALLLFAAPSILAAPVSTDDDTSKFPSWKRDYIDLFLTQVT
jgi:hypothetical protein